LLTIPLFAVITLSAHAALFDNIKLQKVSVPGLFSLLIIAMVFTVLRKRTAGLDYMIKK
jgi:hypothetical protein